MHSKPSNPKDAIGIRKAPMSTVSAAVMAEIGVAMLEGAAKYGRHNYRIVGVQSSVYYDATMRHLMAWWEGEDTDPDSGMSHITKAITSLVVLRDAMIQGKLSDDRPPRSADFYQRLNAQSADVLDRHADKAPVHYTQALVEVLAEHKAAGKPIHGPLEVGPCCGMPNTCEIPCFHRANEPSNLKLMTRSEHSRIHAKEAVSSRKRAPNGQFE